MRDDQYTRFREVRKRHVYKNKIPRFSFSRTILKNYNYNIRVSYLLNSSTEPFTVTDLSRIADRELYHIAET